MRCYFYLLTLLISTWETLYRLNVHRGVKEKGFSFNAQKMIMINCKMVSLSLPPVFQSSPSDSSAAPSFPAHTISITFSLTDYLSRGFSNNVRLLLSRSIPPERSPTSRISCLRPTRDTRGLLLVQPPDFLLATLPKALPFKLHQSSSLSLSLSFFDASSSLCIPRVCQPRFASRRLRRVFSLPSFHPAFPLPPHPIPPPTVNASRA